MLKFLGIVIASKAELIEREELVYRMGKSDGLLGALYKRRTTRISPITGKPVRKYTKKRK